MIYSFRLQVRFEPTTCMSHLREFTQPRRRPPTTTSGSIVKIKVNSVWICMATTSTYIIALAVCDLLCATMEMPLTLCTLISGRWIFGSVVCQIHGFVDVFAASCPPAIMGLTAFNRYIRINKTGYFKKIVSPRLSKLWRAFVYPSLCTWLSRV